MMVPGVGGATSRRLAAHFGGIEAVFDASEDELIAVSRITSEIAVAIREVQLEALENDMESMSDDGIRVVTWDDDDYPMNLRDAADAPALLFASGDILSTDSEAVAIIGTREPSPEAAETAEKLARRLAEAGLTIVSGLAIGIDTCAHKGALTAQEGRTFAIFGSGLRVIHPRSNIELALEIVGRGALLSEYLPGTPPSGPNLMARDRIISGLSKAVIVVEAGVKSGSVDTANRARKQGRAVFAIPGSPGTDALIAGGAIALDPDNIEPEQLLASSTDTAQPVKPQLDLWD